MTSDSNRDPHPSLWQVTIPIMPQYNLPYGVVEYINASFLPWQIFDQKVINITFLILAKNVIKIYTNIYFIFDRYLFR